MDEGMAGLTDGALLAVINDALDELTCPGRVRLASDREQMELLTTGLRAEARLHAWQAGLAAHLEKSEAVWNEHGTSTSTWLAGAVNLTRREAGRLIAAGEGLHRFPLVGAAAAAGDVLPGQADAITSVLDKLPDDFPTETVARAQEMMVGFAADYTSTELRRLSEHLLEVLCPETAEELEAARVEREYRQACQDRYLTFKNDHHGSMLIKGSLPVVDAEPLIRIIDAYAAAAKRGDDVLDPARRPLSPRMRRADALVTMAARHTQDALTPSHGGDRPRIVVTLDYNTLHQTAAAAGFLDAANGNPRAAAHRPPDALGPDGDPRHTADAAAARGPNVLCGHLAGTGDRVPAGALRQWLCDADILPVVLGGPSEVLDVGRSQRLVTPAIRAALDTRDQGCVFPGCDKPPRDCHAHHRVPWWAGGVTALTNLHLFCDHHHGTVEPSRDPTADPHHRWQVRLRPDGITELIPPRRVDPHQRPRTHARFHQQE